MRESSSENLSENKIKSKKGTQTTNQIVHSSAMDKEKMRGGRKDQECSSFQNPSK